MHTAKDDAHYFAEHGRQERDRAERSSHLPARIVHLELAQLYERRSAVSPVGLRDQTASLE